MTRSSRWNHSGRRGAVAPLTVILMIGLLAMVAFAVDIGYIVTVQAEMQNAADSAALAGASQLLVPQMQGITNFDALSSQALNTAAGEAKKFCLYNQAGGVSLNLRDQDVSVGYESTPGSSPLKRWAAGDPFPNTVQVTVSRDGTSNAPVPLFFGVIFGRPSWNGKVSASATGKATGSTVTGFSSPPNGPNALLLPIAVDVNSWNNFLATGQSPDGVVHDAFTAVIPTSTLRPPANVSSGPDNIPEIQGVYPDRTSPGNFGLLDIGPPANDVPAFRNWIDNGASPSDLAYFGPNGLQATPNAPATLKGGPGWKSTLQSSLNGIIGQPRILPLFSSYSGQGSNTYYTIIGFAGVTVVYAEGRGTNETIIFQPMVVVDSTATDGGSSSDSSFIFPTAPIRLSR